MLTLKNIPTIIRKRFGYRGQKVLRIGYQGVVGSNSEEAAKKFAAQHGLSNVEFVPLINSKPVIAALKRRDIDYAVVATKNTLGGTVTETFNAIKTEYLELAATEILHIHHCLFKRRDTPVGAIEVIASHEQALKQTKNTREKWFSHCAEKCVEDTAIAAKHLAEGKLPSNVAVLCRKNAGELYDLELVQENLEDNPENYTEFRIFKLPTIDYENNDKVDCWQKLCFYFINESGIGILSKAIMVLAIFASFYLVDLLQWTRWDTATFVGGYLSVLFLFLTSKGLKNKFRYRSLLGYWKYYSLSDNAVDNKQKFDVPRIVKIEEIDGELFLHGYICDRENIPLFESTKVIFSELGKNKGSLVYWYSNPGEMDRGYALNGLVELNWINKDVAARINRMSGRYLGKATHDVGSVEYLRITEEEFNVHRNCEFL